MTDNEKKFQVMEFAEDADENPEGNENPKMTDKSPGLFKKFSENKLYLAVAAVGVLFVAAVLYSSGAFTGMVVGNQLTSEQAGSQVVDFLDTYDTYIFGGQVQVSLDSVEEESGLYKISLSIENESYPYPFYATKDGEYVIFPNGILNIDETKAEIAAAESQVPQTGEVPTSDRPKVELFIWGYCPYGVQAQGPLADVASLLGEDADFEAVLYYDGHGPFETQQNKIQACIQEIDPDKYWQYASGFVSDIYPVCSSSRDVGCDRNESVKLMQSLGIDDSEVMSCVEDRGEDLISEYSARAGVYGVTGSPTLVINGVKVSPARNAEAFKAAVCSAFNTPPTECDETLSAQSASTASATCG